LGGGRRCGLSAPSSKTQLSLAIFFRLGFFCNTVSFEFIPTKEQAENSNIYRFMQKHGISTLDELSQKARSDLSWYWGAVGEDIGIVWDSKYSNVLDAMKGNAWPKWFVGGRTNIIKSSLEKFAKSAPGKTAYHFVSESGREARLSYLELDIEVGKLANSLKTLGVGKGDVVGIFMPMIREAVVAILACAKIGAVQTAIFSGYSSDSLRIRLQDCKAKILFTSNGFKRRGKDVSQKNIVLDAIRNTSIEKVIVAEYGGVDSYDRPEFLSYSKLTSEQSGVCETETMDSDDPLFILYTSGTTGNPKGAVHAHGGFSVFAGHQAAYLIDFTPEDTLFWPADIGWITGLVWNVYGMLMVGGTAVLYDGALDYPDHSRIWKLLEKFNATIFGTSPTAVRMFKKNNVEPRSFANLDKIKNMPTTGEPIDEDSWHWLFEKVGNRKIPIMNLSGGTEIGGAMLSVLPGMKLKPSTVGIPCPGIDLDIFDDDQRPVRNEKGYLVIKSPWPAMTRGLLNDDRRYLETYWSRFDGVWFHGDYVMRDREGLWYMLGRVDDVINVSGHRLSTAEIEQAVISHEKISDAASISIGDELTGEAIVVYVVPEEPFRGADLADEIARHVSEKIGKIARPKHVCTVSDLPKTRTGKVMRRLLKAKSTGRPLGDTSSLENPGVLDEVTNLQ